MQLGSIAIAGLADQGRTFQNREAVLGYVALNASTGMEDLWAADDTGWLGAPARHIEFPDMWHDGESSCCEEKARQRSRSETSHVIRTTKYERLPWTCGAFFSTTGPVIW